MTRRFRTVWTAVLALSLSGLSAIGQAPPDEQVTVTAHAFPVPFKSLARTVEVITREQIEALPVETVADLIGYAASVEVESRGPFGVQTDFSIRGATFDQVLILIDGHRLNDPQTGHHNGDIPVALEDVERVEILYGSGSSLHGADAVGGVINIVTRRSERRTRGEFSVGQYGLMTGYAGVDLSDTGILESLSLWGNRSSGFAFDRDFRTLGIRLQGRLGSSGRFQLSHLDKRFGAAGFYGPSPSREWTRQTLLALESPVASGEGWTLSTRASFRAHRDHFLWDVERPGYAENFHRDHSMDAGLGLDWRVAGATRLNLGATAGGDWIDSNNLGKHRYSRYGVYGEIEQGLGSRVLLYPGLRYDGSDSFSGSWSPSVSGLVWLTPALKLRSYVGESFRIPTFTERFYSDPNHQADPSLQPERALGFEVGLDWLPSPRWRGGLGVFSRHQRDAIDWIRSDAAERWRTANIRRLQSEGLEASLQRRVTSFAWVGVQYTYLNVRADELELQSKYVSQYARHSLTTTAAFPLLLGLKVGHHLSYRRRRDGSGYWVADLRLTRPVSGSVRLHAEVTNYLNSVYQEIPGVDMPRRWFSVGLEF
jgi:outer membrane cobalamin receptor